MGELTRQIGFLVLSTSLSTMVRGQSESLFPLGDVFSLSAHGLVAAGVSSGEPGDLAVHGHDPNQELALQSLELGLSARFNEQVEGFVALNTFLDTNDDLDSEWEEGFLKLKDLPFGLELRGGRYLNRLGLQNHQHQHAWDFVDANLSTGYFLGHDGLRTDGVELSWFGEKDNNLFGFSASFGRAVSHSHGHEGHDHDDHDDHDHHHEEHGESRELSYFSENFFTLRAFVNHRVSDFHQHQLGVNTALGENGFGRDTHLFSADYRYLWRENGLEAGGRAASIGAEIFYRDVEWRHDEVADEFGKSGQLGAMLSATFDFDERWQLGARYGWIEGVKDGAGWHDGELEHAFSEDERQRLSLALTYRNQFSEQWAGRARLQWNHDELGSSHSEDSLWLQFGFDFGGPEIR